MSATRSTCTCGHHLWFHAMHSMICEKCKECDGFVLNKKILAQSFPVALLLGTIVTMIVFILFQILTPFWVAYANTLSVFISGQIATVPSLSGAQSQLSTLNIQWAIMFFVSFLIGGVVVYLAAYKDEPDVLQGSDLIYNDYSEE